MNDSDPSSYAFPKKEVLEKCLTKHACAPIEEAVPSWPSEKGEHYFTLAREDFTYSHCPSHHEKSVTAPSGSDSEEGEDAAIDYERNVDDLFCTPRSESKRLLSVLTQSKGGSVLITGYRGTGKTSLVNHVIKQLKESDEIKREAGKKEYVKGRLFFASLAIVACLTALAGLPLVYLYIHEGAGNDSWHFSFANLQLLLAASVSLLALALFRHQLILAPVLNLFNGRRLLLRIAELRDVDMSQEIRNPIEALRAGGRPHSRLWYLAVLTVSPIFRIYTASRRFVKYLVAHRILPLDRGPLTVGGCLLGMLRFFSFAVLLFAIALVADYLRLRLIANDGCCIQSDPLGRLRFWYYPGFLALVTADLLGILSLLTMIVRRLMIPSEGRYVRIGINMSSSRDAKALADIMIRELYEKVKGRQISGINGKLFESVYKRSRGFARENHEQTLHLGTGGLNLAGSATPGLNMDLAKLLGRSSLVLGGLTRRRAQEYTEGPYTLHDAQRDIVLLLHELDQHKHTVIFVFDELDKLIPQDRTESKSAYEQMLFEVQSIVADLRFLLVESNAFNIFIAGKIVDDSWHEDQNKGDGLFESVFVQNIYLPSILSLNIEATLGPHKRWLYREWEAWLRETEVGKLLLDPLHKRERQEYFQWLTDGLLEIMLEQLGVHRHDWTYNTSLLILPQLSEDEWRRLILHCIENINDYDSTHHKDTDKDEDKDKTAPLLRLCTGQTSSLPWSDLKPSRAEHSPKAHIKPFLRRLQKAAANVKVVEVRKSTYPTRLECKRTDCSPDMLFVCQYKRQWPNKCTAPQQGTIEERSLIPSSERHCRRLRYLLQYLTFKGRGIPRKILREFYTLIRHRDILRRIDSDSYWQERGDPSYIIYIEDSLRHRIKFYSNIVARLEQNHKNFRRAIGDKGEVALFHIIDHILKFHTSSFVWNDIENASFMSDRQELFPSRELTTTLLGLLEDVLIERLDARHRSYVLLPRIRHDLAALYLHWPSEQIDLRFTETEFRNELERLHLQLKGVESQAPNKRLETVRIQSRIGQIHELIGNHPEAMFAYGRALRWVRTNIFELDQSLLKREAGSISDFRLTALINYLTIGIEITHAMGNLNEKGRELRLALQYYETALSFIEHALNRSPEKDSSSLLGKPLHLRKPGNDAVGVTRLESWVNPYLKAKKAEKIENSESPKVDDEKRDLKSLLPILRERWLRDMNPALGKAEELFPYHRITFPEKFKPLLTSLVPQGFTRTLNLIAIACEKMWHRHAANRYMMVALDIQWAVSDYFAATEQMIFLGEVMMRRRDLRLAARWYSLALEHLLVQEYPPEKEGFTDKRLKLPQPQSSVRAKLFEYLGDVYYATYGRAFLPTADLKKVDEKKDTPKAIEPYRERLSKHGLVNVDPRDDEFFYTLAGHYYLINDQPLRQVDVNFKKLAIRYEKLQDFLRENSGISLGGELPDPPERTKVIGAIAGFWCPFWACAFRTVGALIEPVRGIEGNYAETFLIQDRRRFGILCYHVGRMMELVATYASTMYPFWADRPFMKRWEDHDLKAFNKKLAAEYLREERIMDDEVHSIENGYSNLLEARRNMRKIFRILLDRPDLTLKRDPNFDKDKTIDIFFQGCVEINSMLWNLCSRSWEDACFTADNSQKNPKLAHLQLFSELRNLLAETDVTAPLYHEVESLHLAETALLCAWLSLDDSLHDVNAARICHELGRLYTRGLLLLFSVIDARLDSLNNEPDSQANDFEAALHLLFHAAAKRFLAAAIDMYRSEESSQRMNYASLAQAYTDLGDLMLLRDITLSAISDGSGPKAALYKYVANLLRGERFPSARLLLKIKDPMKPLLAAQAGQCGDNELRDCLYQTTDAYQQSLRVALDEKDEYMKRYRFPHEAFLVYNTVMDRHRHFDISESIRPRHWNGAPGNPIEAVKELQKEVFDLAILVVKPIQPPNSDRTDTIRQWLLELSELLTHIQRHNLEGSLFQIRVCSEASSNDLCIAPGVPSQKEEEKYRRFFRSFDDGLYTKEEEPTPASARPAPD